MVLCSFQKQDNSDQNNVSVWNINKNKKKLFFTVDLHKKNIDLPKSLPQNKSRWKLFSLTCIWFEYCGKSDEDGL